MIRLFATLYFECLVFFSLHAIRFGYHSLLFFSYGLSFVSFVNVQLKLILCWLIFVSCPFFFRFHTHTWTHLLIHCAQKLAPILFHIRIVVVVVVAFIFCIANGSSTKRPNNIRVCYLIFQQTMSAFVTKHLIYFVDFVFL